MRGFRDGTFNSLATQPRRTFSGSDRQALFTKPAIPRLPQTWGKSFVSVTCNGSAAFGLDPERHPIGALTAEPDHFADLQHLGVLPGGAGQTDVAVLLDPRQYLMPSDTNMRTVFVDNSTTPVTFWVGSNHDHRLVKVEPLD
jgi:hypothetical protein